MPGGGMLPHIPFEATWLLSLDSESKLGQIDYGARWVCVRLVKFGFTHISASQQN